MVCSLVTSLTNLKEWNDKLCLTVMCVWLVLNTCVKDIDTTLCKNMTTSQDFFHVMRMCSDSTLHNTRIVIDTWDTGGPDVYSCICTVTLHMESTPSTGKAHLTVTEYPNIAPTAACASKFHITSTTPDTFSETGCSPIHSTSVQHFGTNDRLTLSLVRAESETPWQSGHCILISSESAEVNYDVRINCVSPNVKPDQPTVPNKPSSTTPKTTARTTTKTTTTTPKLTSTTTKITTTLLTTTTTTAAVSTTTITKPETPERLPSSTGSTTESQTILPESTERFTVESGNNNSETNIGIIAGAAGGGGLLVVIAVIAIIVIIRKRTANKPPHESVDNAYGNSHYGLVEEPQPNTSKGAMPRYVNDHGDTLTHNSLYQSAGPRDPDARHIVTEAGDVYAQVQNPGKQSICDNKENEKLELEETPKGDVYAVVNKSKKQNNSETVDNPSRYTSADGLVYAEVGVQDGTARPSTRVKSGPPPVSPKPKVDSESVVYAEVNTDI